MVVVPDLAFLARVLADPLDEGLIHLVVGDLDIGLVADLRKDEPEPHPALGDAAVFGARLLLGRVLVGEGLVGVLEVHLDLRPHRRELLLDERLRQLEGVFRVERVEELLLELAPRMGVVVALDRAADCVLELVERLHAEALGELVVDLDLARRLDLLHGDVELGLLAGEVRGAVVRREGDLHLAALAGLGADELLLEARDERARAELDLDALALAALELLAVDAAGEVDDDAIAGLRPGLGGLCRERPVLRRHALERLLAGRRPRLRRPAA